MKIKTTLFFCALFTLFFFGYFVFLFPQKKKSKNFLSCKIKSFFFLQTSSNNKTDMFMHLLTTWMNKRIFQKKICFLLFFVSTKFCGICEFDKGLFLLEVCKKKKLLILQDKKFLLFFILRKRKTKQPKEIKIVQKNVVFIFFSPQIFLFNFCIHVKLHL